MLKIRTSPTSPGMAMSRSLETEFSACDKSPGNANEAMPRVNKRVTKTAEDHIHHWRRAILRMWALISSARAGGGVWKGSGSAKCIKPLERELTVLRH